MKTWIWLAICASLALRALAAAPASQIGGYQALKDQAEKLYDQRSFAKARDLYQQASSLSLPPDEKRWVEFRLADTQWRSEAASQTADTTKLDQALHQLEVLVRDVTRVEEHDRVWVEIQESLGDYHWIRRNAQNWSAAWPYYQQALDWWAGAPATDLARDRYLAIVWRLAKPPTAEPYYAYGAWGNMLPLQILENALQISRTENEKAHAHYLIAMTLRAQGGDWDLRARVPDEFEAALKGGKATDWYDDALYQYAEWMMGQGRAVQLEDGNWRQEPDYVKALSLFRRIVSEFNKGETRYWEQAQNQITSISNPQLNVSVANIFLPGSEIQYSLSWRNVKRIELALYPVELNRDLHLKGQTHWVHCIDLSRSEAMKSWSKETQDKGDYVPGNETLRLDEKLKPGAYVVEVRAGGNSSRDLILVTDAALVLKSSGKQALVWFCNALNGEPLGGSRVKLTQRWFHDNTAEIKELEMTADADGIARFQLDHDPRNNSLELFASAVLKDRQAFCPGTSYEWNRGSENWKIYAFTDRPAYRPKETVQWKFIVRQYNGSVYSTPSGKSIEYQINDPRGAKVKEGKAELNAFGSVWGSVDLTEQMPLGEYHVQFWEEGRGRHIGTATLFRLEEYKLPEFKVSLKTPEEQGRKKAFRLGEKVDVTIQADYYFGGPVANAAVEVLVYQNPYYHYWHAPREYPWFYEDIDAGAGRWNRWYGGQGQVIKRETIKTDATGKASVTFDTPSNIGQDYEYRIEARVTDSSRREIVGNGSVRVTRQRYYVYANAAHNLYRPQDKVEVEFKALDANEQPVQTEGLVKITRQYWYEVWINPEGKEVKGQELSRLQSTLPVFPPTPKPGTAGWTLKFRGYEHDEILSRTVKTDTNGMAELSFTPGREGYYRIAWSSQDSVKGSKPGRPSTPITTETAVWVGTAASTDLGYRSGGLQIIVDKETFRAGQKAPVMLVGPANDRHALFTVEGEDLYSYQVVHLEGTVKLLELAIEEKHVPNIFLGAVMLSDRQVYMDSKQVIIPPAKNFLTVEVKPDRAQYEPREEGQFTVTARDHEGKPVAAELSFGLVDESVLYIQQDYAGDPRQFYFGTKRPQLVQTQTTFNQKGYARLVNSEGNRLIDEKDAERRSDRSAGEWPPGKAKDETSYVAPNGRTESDSLLQAGGRAGFALGGAMPAAAPMRKMEAAESRTGANLYIAFDKPLPEGEPIVQVRSDFRSTVLWRPDVVTDRNGTATLKVKYPDSLTGWKATARAATAANQFGIAETVTRTKQPLIVRLQAPRFFLVGDTVTLSAVLNNNTEDPASVRVQLEAAGAALQLKREMNQTVNVPANGEARVDWIAVVTNPGEVKLKVTARGDKHADAMEKAFTAYEHGIEKFIAKSGKGRANDFSIKLDLPKERKAGSTILTVQMTPSMAVTMLDALPYLIRYPYGCTEQTMSRFLPAAITGKTLKDLGLQPEDVMNRVFGGIEQATAAATHPDGKRDLAELEKVVSAGLDRLADFQHGDGGWGWWKQGESDHWMSAYVVWGLTLATDAGVVGIKAGMLDRGANYLNGILVEEEENPDMQAWVLHALAVYDHSKRIGQPTPFQAKGFENLWNNREKLNAYTRALLALSAHHFGKAEQAKILVQNLENGVKRDERPDTSVLINPAQGANQGPSTVMSTAHWGEDGLYWRWSDGGVEATAFALRALLAIDPQNKLVEPVVNWLIKNRRGAQWNSTRDTAIVVLTMNDYLRASGELKGELDCEVLINGTSIAREKIAGADIFKAPSRYVVDPKLIKDSNEIRFKSRGSKANLYFAAEAKFFSLEEPVAPAGNEIFVKREYFKLVGRPTLLKGVVYEKQPVPDGASVKSGERVQTLVTIEAKNNYEYLVFEDLKPAGFEAVELRSGEPLYAHELKSGAVERKFQSKAAAAESKPEPVRVGSARLMRPIRPPGGIAPTPQPAPDQTDLTGRTRWVYQELRDRKVALFLDKLPQGVWEIRYDFRAEVPGQFHALPVMGYAMYVPEIRANGQELRVTVTDPEAAPK